MVTEWKFICILSCVLQDGEEEGKEEFAIVFAAMGVNMETAHYFKQVRTCPLCISTEIS